ncbi:MAG: hypothetical protein JRH17_16765 [Deltaproteobacteria bacterium]|nr:hypothetical protein [Deltaproteobacteria bacterium]
MSDAVDRYFMAYDELGDTPNIIVDGSGNPATQITLSHWPKSGAPKALKADTSAEIVFNYLDSPDHHVTARAVSNNHFDEDGLVGLFTLVEPTAALALRPLFCDVARAGDFATYDDRQAARIAFTVSAFADPDLSPLDEAIFSQPYGAVCASLYSEILPRFHDIAVRTDDFRDLWSGEDRALDESERAIAEGAVTIEEDPALDLAVVRIPADWSSRPVHRFTQLNQEACHPMAIHNATRCNRVLTIHGRRYTFLYRYESWVQYISAPPPPRVDLGPLAAALSREEPGGAKWHFDGVSELTPRLTLHGAGESVLAPERFHAALTEALATGKPAWDPYDA